MDRNAVERPRPEIGVRTVGDVEILAILDGASAFDAGAISAIAPDFARPLNHGYPGEFNGEEWVFLVRVFLVRTHGVVVLFDAGIGPASTPLAQTFGHGGQLLEALSLVGIGPDEVTHVVISHHHDDHIGWLWSDTSARDPFGSARVLISAEEVELGRVSEGGYGAVFEGLAHDPRVVPVRDSYRLAPRLVVRDAPGHTAGHIIMELDGEDERVLFTGDLLHFQYQLSGAHESGPFDADAAQAQHTRASELTSGPIVLASAHLPDAFTEIDAPMTY